MRFFEFAPLFLEPRELRRLPVVESAVAGRRGLSTAPGSAGPGGRRRRARRLHGGHRRSRFVPLGGSEGLQVVAAELALPELITQDRQADRPKHANPQYHGDHSDPRPAAAAARPAPAGVRPLVGAELTSTVRTAK